MMTDRWRHKNRGTTYRIVAVCRLHTSVPLRDMDDVSVFTDHRGTFEVYPPGEAFAANAKLQTTNPIEPGGVWVVVYLAEKDGSRWVRPALEFFDGRFEYCPCEIQIAGS